MRAPDHWYEPPGWRAQLLQPVATAYAAIARLRQRMIVPQRASLPVVCVGNITAGGSGKTPVAIALARRLSALGERPVFLTRGYGGRVPGPILVDADRALAIDVGDEPLLLARFFPTIVSGNRPKGADTAALTDGSVVVMDDGYQNPSLQKDAGILVADADVGLGNGRLIPAGPLRELPQAALERADALVLMGDGRAGDAIAAQAEALGVPTFHGRLEPVGDRDQWRGRRVLAFAGIGRPSKFFASLDALGVDIREQQIYADHHVYTDDEAQAMLSRARAHGLELVTTQKDQARLRGSGHSGALAELYATARTLEVEVAFDDAAGLDQILKVRINAATHAGAYRAF